MAVFRAISHRHLPLIRAYILDDVTPFKWFATHACLPLLFEKYLRAP
jgi:hypothetical protein